MIEIRTLDMGGCALGNRPDVGGERFGIAPLETLVALPESFGDGLGHGFAGGLGDRLGETVGFRILDVEAHGVSSLLYQSSTFPL